MTLQAEIDHEEQSEQTIGVLVAAVLPRAAWIAEINLHVGRDCETLMVSHLLAATPTSASHRVYKRTLRHRASLFDHLVGPLRSWRHEESQVESSEHQNDANIHYQPFPESVSEEHEIYTDYNGCHRHHVKHYSYPSVHFSTTSFHFLRNGRVNERYRGRMGSAITAETVALSGISRPRSFAPHRA